MSMNNIETIKSKLKPFIGTKKIKATPMTWGQYCKLREWDTKADNDSNLTDKTPGYLVEYPDAEHRNDTRFDGYISWSPSNTFDESYQLAETEQNLIKIDIRRTEAEMERLQNRLNAEVMAPNVVITSDHKLVKIQISLMQAYLQVLHARFFDLSTVKLDSNSEK